jgi:hypothetical protein
VEAAGVNYESIKALAKERGHKVDTLLAMSRTRDPFFCGSEGQRQYAEWFLGIWERFGFTAPIHLRRIHYRIISNPEPILLLSGKPYQNTERCWDSLIDAARCARCLRLVNPSDFVDMRNGEPRIYSACRTPPRPGFYFPDEVELWRLPLLHLDLSCDLSLAAPEIHGYDYSGDHADQRYFLQMWIEKSTMDDVLAPICRRYGVDLVTGAGFQSITSVVRMLAERNPMGKPARIFYISDFDPGGEGMPIATARQIEFWRPQYAPDLEIKLHHLALTREQADEYRLPRTPIKETDKRRRGFEERRGQGAVELDALEALHPGELARIVEEDAFQPYFDKTLDRRLSKIWLKAASAAKQAWEAELEEQDAELDSIRTEAEAIAQKYAAQLEPLRRDFEMEMQPLRDQLELVQHAVQVKADEFSVDLPPRPEPAEADADESDWLFDSNREYLEQIAVYKRHKE